MIANNDFYIFFVRKTKIMSNKCKSCSSETHYECASCFKHGVQNRPECSFNVSEDEGGYQEDSPKRMSRCYGCQNVLT